MLAMADRNGFVFGSLPGLAHRARVSVDECRAALRTFLEPDPESRTAEHGGRRIAVIDGGWELLNHAKYRAIKDAESLRESKRNHMRRARASGTVVPQSNSPSASGSASGVGSGSDPDAREPAATGSFPAVLRTLPEGYTPSPSLLAQVASAGCPREVFEARLAELRTGPIGGSRGVLPNQLEKYLLTQASKWRNWNAADVAKQANGRPRRDAPNQPNAGITGLEKAKVVR